LSLVIFKPQAYSLNHIFENQRTVNPGGLIKQNNHLI